MGRPKKSETSETQKEFVRKWKTEIEEALEYRKRTTTESRWKDYRKMYRGDWASDVLPVNRTFSYGRALIPRVYFKAPRISVTARRPEFVWHARVVEAIDNWLVQELKLKKTLKRAALDAFYAGFSPIKLGFDSEYGFIPDLSMLQNNESITQMSKEDEGLKIEYKDYIKPGMPWALAQPPEDTVWPYGYRDPEDLPWVAFRYLRPLDEIKKDLKYQNTDKIQGTYKAWLDMGRKKTSFPDAKSKGTNYAELWEIRDKKTEMVYTICEGYLLLGTRDELQVDGLPVEWLIWNLDTEWLGGISDIKILEPQQLELNELRTQERAHRRIALIKFLYRKGVLTKDQRDLFLSGEVGPAVEVDTDESLASAITTLQPHVPGDFTNLGYQVSSDMRDSIGFSENQAGAFKGGTPPTMTETMQVAQSFDIRQDERRDIISDVFAAIIQKWNKMLFKFWTESKVIEIVGPDGANYWVEYTGKELEGDYMLQVDVEAGIPISRALRYQTSKEVFALFNGDPTIDQLKLREITLRNLAWVDPEYPQLLKGGMPPEQMTAEAQMRQPFPMLPGQHGGGRQGQSRENPIQFEKLRTQMER